MNRAGPRASAALTVGFALLLTSPSFAVVETFDGVSAGTVVAGETPGGGVATGDTFAGFVVSVVNNGAGPQSAIIFDSSSPTGEDSDLGTPNESCGGPGIGAGGANGTVGENCVGYGNLLIVAEDIEDSAPADGRVDDPDDEALGGTISFRFPTEVAPRSIVIVDVDFETVRVKLVGATTTVIDAADLGNNSVQTLDLTGYGEVIGIEVFFSSSGAVAQLEYELLTSPTEQESWAEVKNRYR